MYIVSFIDDGKLVQITTPTATIAAIVKGYLPQARVFLDNRLLGAAELETLAIVQEAKRRYRQIASA